MYGRRRRTRRSLTWDNRLMDAVVQAIRAHLCRYPTQNTVTDVMEAMRAAEWSVPTGRGWFELYLQRAGFTLTDCGQAGGGIIVRVTWEDAR